VNVASVIANLPYDPIRSFAPIGQFVGGGPQFMLVLPSLGPKSFEEFLALAKSRPGKLTYGSQGSGSIQHLIGELLRRDAGIDWVHVPFKGGAPAMTALLGGHIDVLLTDASAFPSIEAGKVRALAVTTEKRVARLPDLPTVGELGYPNATTDIGFALFAPAGTPRPIVDRLNTVLRSLPSDPDMQNVVAKMSLVPVATSPEDLRARLVHYSAQYGPLIKALNLKVE
jgi:tripartite-type tricarboxylate transporter receptor subunit TctC